MFAEHLEIYSTFFLLVIHPISSNKKINFFLLFQHVMSTNQTSQIKDFSFSNVTVYRYQNYAVVTIIAISIHKTCLFLVGCIRNKKQKKYMYSKASEHVYKTAVKLILQISIQLTLYKKNSPNTFNSSLNILSM